MRKNLYLLLAITLGLSLFTGCKGEEEAEKTPEESAQSEEESEETDENTAESAGEEAPAATADGSETPEVPTQPRTPTAPNIATNTGTATPPTTVTSTVTMTPQEERAAAVKKAQSEREQRIKSIYALSRNNDEASIQELIKIAQNDEQVGIRATAIRVLGQKKREDLIPLFKNTVEKDTTMVQLEAAIVLYKWGEQKFALPILEKYSDRGVALRRAFMTGRKDGKGLYDKNAKKFLKKGLKSTNVLTQLDAAVGLYELGEEKKSLKIFREVMEGDHKHQVRIAALNYLRHLKKDNKVRAIIQIAAGDTNERVKQRANDILAQTPR